MLANVSFLPHHLALTLAILIIPTSTNDLFIPFPLENRSINGVFHLWAEPLRGCNSPVAVIFPPRLYWADPEATLLSSSSRFGRRRRSCRWRLLLSRIFPHIPPGPAPARQRAGCKPKEQRPAASFSIRAPGDPTGPPLPSPPPPALTDGGAGRDHRRCRCLSRLFQGILHHLHCSPRLRAPSSSRGGGPRTRRTDDGSGSPARRSQDVGSGRPVRDAAAWASLWILKHLCGCVGRHVGGGSDG